MRRRRHRGETKVWHDPLMTAAGQRKQQAPQRNDGSEQRRANRDRRRKVEPARRPDARIIGSATGTTDPQELERERLLDRLLAAEGRPSITTAADAFRDAGFEFPQAQEIWLQLLEHQDEERITEAIEQFAIILADEPPQRRAVLESRLRRIEEYADESSTKQAATSLRRMLSTTNTVPPTGPPTASS